MTARSRSIDGSAPCPLSSPTALAPAGSEPLRILHLYPKADYFTGAAIQLLELAAGLRRRGHDVVVATRPHEDWARRTRQRGITQYGLSMRSGADLRSVWHLVRIIRWHRVQIVHAHKGKARTLAVLAGMFVRIPVLVLNRGVSFPVSWLSRLGYTSPRVTAIVAVCESIRQALVRQGMDPAKIEVIHSATDTQRFHPGIDGRRIRDELGLTAEHFLITQIGVRSGKGNDDVLEALASVIAALPRARLLFVGANDGKARWLRERAAALGLSGAVSVLPYRDDVPQILAASDVIVDASHTGLGLTGTVREALAVETPVVATDAEGNPELVISGQTGTLVKPRDPAGLAAALLAIAANPTHAKAMARAGRRLVETRFSTEAKLERIESLYRRLLARTDRPRVEGRSRSAFDPA
jgi:glycosyltransferase involved in cell wall biosynthesis